MQFANFSDILLKVIFSIFLLLNILYVVGSEGTSTNRIQSTDGKIGMEEGN